MQTNLMKLPLTSLSLRFLLIVLTTLLAILHGYGLYSATLWLPTCLITGILLGLSLKAWHFTSFSGSPSRDEQLRNLLIEFIEFCRSINLMEWTSLLLLPLGIVRLYVQHLNLSLHHFEDRTLGIAVLEGIDVAARSRAAIASIAIGMGVLLLVLICLFVISVGWQISTQQKQMVRHNLQPVHHLSIILIAIYGLVGDYALETQYFLLLQWIIVLLALYPMLRFSVETHPALLNTLAATLLFATLGISAYLWHLSPASNEHLPIVLWASVAIGIGVVPRLIAWGSRRIAWFPSSVALACAPLILLPAASFVADEIGFALLRRFGNAPNLNSLIRMVMIGCIALSLLMLLVSRFRFRPRLSNILRWLIYPCILVSIGALYSYKAPGDFRADWFHYGEELLPAHQLIRFGKLPYIDVLPTHGLLMPLISVIHMAFNGGWIGTDTSYFVQSVSVIVALIIGYLLVTKVYQSPTLAMIHVITLPNIAPWWFQPGTPYILALLGILLIARLLHRPSQKAAWAAGFGLVPILLLLRLDTLMILVVISVVLWAIRWLPYPLRSLQYGLPLAVPSLVTGAAVLILLFGKLGFPLGLDRIKQILTFGALDYQSMSVGTPEFFSESVSPVIAYLIAFGLPLIVLLLAVQVGMKVLPSILRDQSPTQAQMIALGIAGFSLGMWLRAFQRHTQFEDGLVPVFGILPLAVIVLAFAWKPSPRTLFVAVGLIFSIMVLSLETLAFPIRAAAETTIFADRGPIRTFEITGARFDDYSRYWPEPVSLTQVRDFLDAHLDEGRTAIYWGWHLQLYLQWELEFPGFYFPTMHTTGDMVQATYLEGLSQHNPQFFVINTPQQSQDEMPDAVRSYRVFEYLYSEFTPVARIGNFIIFESNIDDHALVAESHNSPPRLDESLSANDLTYQVVDSETILLTPTGRDPYIVLPIRDAHVEQRLSLCRIDFELKTERSGLNQVYWSNPYLVFSEEQSIKFEVQGGDEWRTVSLPVYGQGVAAMRFDSPENMENDQSSIELRNIRFRLGPYAPFKACLPETYVFGPENFDLGHVAHLWAEYDPYHSLSESKMVRSLTESNANSHLILKSGESLSIPLGNYRGQIGDYLLVRAAFEGESASQISNLRINYETGLDGFLVNNWFKFKLVPSSSKYLVRLSTQYAWVGNLIDNISLTNESDLPISITDLEIRREGK